MTALRHLITPFPVAFAALVALSGCSALPPEEPAEVPVETPAEIPAGISQPEVVEAALAGKIEIVEQALEQGYKVNARLSENRTVLMYAAFNGQTNVVKTLINAGADVNAIDQIGSTALMFAASGPFPDTVALLLDYGATINAIDGNEHFTALMWAAAEGQAEVVALLLKRGADPSLKDVDGDTAESFAAKNGHVAVVKILKEASLAQEK